LGIAAVLCAAASTLAAQSPPEAGSGFEAGLRWQTGEVSLGGGIATLRVTRDWRFLGPDDAERVLVEAWQNPPDEEKPLGMLFPAEVGPLDPDGWGVVISYSAEGHVSDHDAEAVDYDALLRDMQEQVGAANEARERAGYPEVQLVGWAARPYYDRATHKLHWARELRFGADADRTLNYDVRVLGRSGVLVMQAVAPMAQSQAVQARMRETLALVEFAPGHRYEEFESGVDEVAAYGVGGLVAGGLLAKAGFFKALLAGILAAKKLIAVGALAGGAALVRYLRRTQAAKTP
jgi:uncharacterized membrane-anchored protein